MPLTPSPVDRELHREPDGGVFDLVSPRVLLAGIVAVVAVIWLPTLGFGFVYDDHWTLLGNGLLRMPGELGILLGPRAMDAHVPDPFRPTLVLFDAASYAAFGVHPIAHHAVSVVLHLFATLGVALWLRGLGAPLPLRVSAAALFGVLAIHAEAIAVVSFREDLLATALGLFALVLADRAVLPSRLQRLQGLGAGVLMAAACGAKLSVAPLPLVWMLARGLQPWPRPAASRRAQALVGLVLLLGVALVLGHRFALLGGVSPYGETTRVFAHRVGLGPVLAASTQIHLGHLQQMLVPIGLQPEYVDFGAKWTDPATVLASAALLGLLGLGLASLRRRPVLALVVLATVLLALPTSNLAPMPNMRAERFMYCVSVPVCVGLAAACLALGRGWAARPGAPPWIVLVPLSAYVIVQGAFGQGAASVYASEGRLWEIALRRAPHSARANAIMGELWIARMRHSERAAADLSLRARARGSCANALRLDPLDDLGHMCRARLATVQRDWSTAYVEFERAVELSGPRADRALVALASTALDENSVPYAIRKQRAFAHLERAVREYPYVAEVFAVAARIHHRLGAPEQAARLYRRASALRPERWDLVLWGLELQLDLGDASAASRAWTASTKRLREADPAARNTVGRRLADALDLFDPHAFDDAAPSGASSDEP